MKALLKKGDEPCLALLAYRSTPLSNGYSPAELLMNRKLRTNVPSSREARKPQVPDRKLVVEREEEQRRKQKANFDRRHRARDLSPALPGDLVWIPDRREQGTVGDEIAPRSYKVETPSGTYRRNRRDIIRLPAEDISPGRSESHDSDSDETMSDDRSQSGESGGGLPSPPTHSLRRSSRVTYKPDRYDPCAR